MPVGRPSKIKTVTTYVFAFTTCTLLSLSIWGASQVTSNNNNDKDVIVQHFSCKDTAQCALQNSPKNYNKTLFYWVTIKLVQ